MLNQSELVMRVASGIVARQTLRQNVEWNYVSGFIVLCPFSEIHLLLSAESKNHDSKRTTADLRLGPSRRGRRAAVVLEDGFSVRVAGNDT